MSRYVNDIKVKESAGTAEKKITDYLTIEGFYQVKDGTETIWKKGFGLMLGPQYVKVEIVDGGVHLEAWIKFALLPGVFMGEMDTNGAFGFIPKKKLKGRIEEIEKLIS